jgi:hypothetical protein
MEKIRNAQRDFLGNLKGRDNMRDWAVYRMIILKCSLR